MWLFFCGLFVSVVACVNSVGCSVSCVLRWLSCLEFGWFGLVFGGCVVVVSFVSVVVVTCYLFSCLLFRCFRLFVLFGGWLLLWLGC